MSNAPRTVYIFTWVRLPALVATVVIGFNLGLCSRLNLRRSAVFAVFAVFAVLLDGL